MERHSLGREERNKTISGWGNVFQREIHSRCSFRSLPQESSPTSKSLTPFSPLGISENLKKPPHCILQDHRARWASCTFLNRSKFRHFHYIIYMSGKVRGENAWKPLHRGRVGIWTQLSTWNKAGTINTCRSLIRAGRRAPHLRFRHFIDSKHLGAKEN